MNITTQASGSPVTTRRYQNERALLNAMAGAESAESAEQAPTGICSRCHRVLKDPKSVERGRGPVCERKYQAAVAEAAKLTSEAQAKKAVALLQAGGVAKNAMDSFYTVTTQNGIWRTDRTLCTCPAGQNGRVCYHLLAVNLVEVKAVKLPVAAS